MLTFFEVLGETFGLDSLQIGGRERWKLVDEYELGVVGMNRYDLSHLFANDVAIGEVAAIAFADKAVAGTRESNEVADGLG